MRLLAAARPCLLLGLLAVGCEAPSVALLDEAELRCIPDEPSCREVHAGPRAQPAVDHSCDAGDCRVDLTIDPTASGHVVVDVSWNGRSLARGAYATPVASLQACEADSSSPDDCVRLQSGGTGFEGNLPAGTWRVELFGHGRDGVPYGRTVLDEALDVDIHGARRTYALTRADVVTLRGTARFEGDVPGRRRPWGLLLRAGGLPEQLVGYGDIEVEGSSYEIDVFPGVYGIAASEGMRTGNAWRSEAGWARVAEALDLSRDRELDIEPRTVRLHGELRGGAVVPIELHAPDALAGRRLTLELDDGRTRYETRVYPGRWDLRLPDGTPLARDVHIEGDTRLDLDFSDARVSVAARVTLDGAAMPAGRLELTPSDDGARPAVAELEAGEARLTLPAGSLELRVTWPELPGVLAAGAFTVDAELAVEPAPLATALGPAVPVYGEVAEAEGVPAIRGVRLVRHDGSGWHELAVEPDTSRFAGRVLAGVYDVYAELAVGSARSRGRILVEPCRSVVDGAPIDLALAWREVTLRAFDPDGVPLPEVVFTVAVASTRHEGESRRVAAVHTAGDGHTASLRLPPGIYEVTARFPSDREMAGAAGTSQPTIVEVR